MVPSAGGRLAHYDGETYQVGLGSGHDEPTTQEITQAALTHREGQQ